MRDTAQLVDGWPPFVIFALPRSRTFWCSRFLSYGGWHCGHEQAMHLRTLDDVKSWLAQPCTGTVETAAASFWRLLQHYRADARIAVIRRPVEQVLASLMRQLPFDEALLKTQLTRLDAKLDQIAQRCPGALVMNYSDLSREIGCAMLFQHCLPYQHDSEWWWRLAGVDLQIDLGAMMRYAQAHAPQLQKMAQMARQRMLADMQPATAPEGVTFQAEPFSWEVFKEAIPLFREHLVQTDQSPEAYLQKNLPVLDGLARIGALQCMTARCNGRLFGYLVSIVSPSVDSPARTEAQHTIFFAHPGIKNLGMGLQRAAVEALKQRGVTDLYMRAGVRGAGPRLGTFYRRLGAQAFGQLYHLSLEEAE